jgi:hypothetical protein
VIYTAWGEAGCATCLIQGSGPPRYADGTLMEDCPDLIWTIEADTWEDAMRRYHELQGWKSYIPMGGGSSS